MVYHRRKQRSHFELSMALNISALLCFTQGLFCLSCASVKSWTLFFQQIVDLLCYLSRVV